MNKLTCLIIMGLTPLLSCKKDNVKFPKNDQNSYNDTIINSIKHPKTNNEKTLEKLEKRELPEGDYCFLKVDDKDSTIVKLRILSADDIRGEMVWQPWQKEGAVGILTGKMNSNHEMELLYDYTIEGNRQTETKIMKIENGILMIKVGELTDPRNDGNLYYKDILKAEFKEILNPTKCSLLE